MRFDMQKGEKKKLQLLLTGIRARLMQNKEYFVSTTFTFRSGKKKFHADLTLGENGEYTLVFQGTRREIDAEEAMRFFDQQSELFEESVLTYTERGSVITISCNTRGVTMKQTEQQAAPEQTAAAANPLLESGRQYLIRVDKAPALLREIGILTAEGKVRNDMIRKYNQIDHYVELVAPMLEQCKDEEIVLLDCACGKSYLSFVMNYYICEVLRRRCRIIGVDINAHSLRRAAKWPSAWAIAI